MTKFITPRLQILSKILILCSICMMSFGQFINKKWPEAQLITPNGPPIKVSWAISITEKVNGLSNLESKKMNKDQGLVFFYTKDQDRVFWMPETFFNLDIIFLDKNFKIVGLEENIKHFKKRVPDNDIPRTKAHYSRHVLELHAGQAKKLGLKKGITLKWKNPNKVKPLLKSFAK